MKEHTGPYMLYDEREGEYHGEYDSIDEAVGTAACLKEREYFLTTSMETGHEVVVTVEDFQKLLKEYWDKLD